METNKKIRGRYSILIEILPDYLNKKITRKEICKKYNFTNYDLREFLRRKGVKIWDYERKKIDKNAFLKDAESYQKNKITIKELAIKYNLSEGTIKNKLRQLNIEINKKKVKESKSKYYNIKEECKVSEYARFFYEFNK